jgi:UDP-galactopyranose mutase
MAYDYIVIGAGIAGLSIANILANKNKKVLIIEQRDHIGGNCYDYYQNGILIHKYGPHIFHTNNKKVHNFLSQFTYWNNYKHKVKVSLDNKLITFPINLNSFFEIFNSDKNSIMFTSLVDKNEISIYELLNSNDTYLKGLGKVIYKNIYENYTIKQWGLKPEEIDRSILERIKIRNSCENNYFLDKYQGIPKDGYEKMFIYMVFHKNIEIKFNINYSILEKYENIIYTGKVDALFDYCYEKLPYRSLSFKNNLILDTEYNQECGVINYPNSTIPYTRITEYKYLTQQKHKDTIISIETPKEYEENDIPYYPILNKKNIDTYNKYKKLTKKYHNLILLGRLAEYKYYNMDEVVLKALEIGSKL